MKHDYFKRIRLQLFICAVLITAETFEMRLALPLFFICISAALVATAFKILTPTRLAREIRSSKSYAMIFSSDYNSDLRHASGSDQLLSAIQGLKNDDEDCFIAFYANWCPDCR